MTMNHAPTPALHVQHYVEIPFTWSADRIDDESFQSDAWSCIEAEAQRLCAALGLELDPAGAISEEGIRLKGTDLGVVLAAGSSLAEFLSLQSGLVFLQQVEERS
ncbi:hypothetical protein LCG56_28465 (plasmid) [Pseudomonas cannabina pv. alisalensis]|uniref:Uncharacterized protein n=1 Tax=Pseudomonas syringae pv. maculicola str. ES4326 TaxID=629265 RepID=A0A8T8CAN9_PSEYM|nr:MULTISPECIES: hypothetical protein [Pseudomonas syringae group]QHF00696.1 hypothetical protein PMA4326_029835 [Pseudomonas syringae pv. maculicola str. ES4326]UBZ00305.1 hypothetical protein LCG56_28465 [Pseudomonas cannabina pv. alisalensis]